MRRSRQTLASLVLPIAVCCCAGWFGLSSEFGGQMRPLSGFDGVLYDAAAGVVSRLRGSPWARTAVVLIDQQTLASAAWSSAPRPLQQPQLGQLGRAILDLGAHRIGYDLVLAFDPADLNLPFSTVSAYDAAFSTLLTERPTDVVLGTDAAILPAPRYLSLLPPTALGAIDLMTETDGVVRTVVTRTRLPGGRRVLGFAEALALDRLAGAPATSSRAFVLPAAAIDEIPHLSASILESCLATQAGAATLRALFKDRIVVVGGGLAGEDSHRGPDRFVAAGPDRARAGADPCAGASGALPSRAIGQLPGAFMQAAAVESLLSPARIALAPAAVRVVANILVAVLALVVQARVDRHARLPARRGWMFGTSVRAAIALALVLVLFSIAAVEFETASLMLLRLWIPIGATLVLIGILGVSQTIVMAVRRDVALADLRISFGRWLPAPVIEATLGARPGLVQGEERVITVLMADLMNFTTFCAGHRHQPERVVAALNQKFSSAQSAIDRHGGCLDKFDGDAVIAFWNGIVPQEDHARRAIAAARDILAGDDADPSETLKFKCAVATGIAFVGCYGSEQKSSFSAIGEPMNLAARLEALCRPYGIRIVIAEASVQSYRDAAEAAPLRPSDMTFSKVGAIELKGFPDPMMFYTMGDATA